MVISTVFINIITSFLVIVNTIISEIKKITADQITHGLLLIILAFYSVTGAIITPGAKKLSRSRSFYAMSAFILELNRTTASTVTTAAHDKTMTNGIT